MFHYAYALFFVLVLAGSGLSLWRLVERHAELIAASLRSELPGILVVLDPASVRVRRERRPAFPQIVFSISRP